MAWIRRTHPPRGDRTDPDPQHLHTLIPATDRTATAEQALAFAAAKLSERDATFSAAQLEREASIRARGSAAHADILAAIAQAEAIGDLVSRTAPKLASGAAGFATRQAVATETRMLAIEAAGRERFTPLHNRIHAARTIAAAELAAADHGHGWTDSQREATRGLLLSSASVTAIQGHAGTATVIATYAKAARDQGLTVRAPAPTATAAELLGQAIDAEPLTLPACCSARPTISSAGARPGSWTRPPCSPPATARRCSPRPAKPMPA